MCGSCESDHSRRYTSTRVILLVFLTTLIALSVAGLIERSRSSDARALAPCAAASTAAVRFQSAVTHDLSNHTRLHSDTRGFASELRSLGATGCPGTRSFIRSADETLGGLCKDCAAELRRSPAAP